MSDLRVREAEDLTAPESGLDLRRGLHRYLIDRIEEDHVDVGEIDAIAIRAYVRDKTNAFVTEKRVAVNHEEFADLVDGMIHEISALGPIQPLIEDDSISDILINGHDSVFVERGGRLEPESIRFIDDDHLLRIIQRIVAPLGRRVDESSPMVDARLPDGSRVNAIIPPVALEGPCLSIRKFRAEALETGDLLAYGTVDPTLVELLTRIVQSRCNVLVSGGTGAGKTTLLNILGRFISPEERLLLIEDTAELNLQHPHVVRLETRPANLEGEGEVSARDLVRNALRMRPDRILVGEIRSVEVADMLQAMNTGHAGSMATIHGNSPREALSRVELLMGFEGFSGSESTLRNNIANALDFIVQIARLENGQRRVTAVTEVVGVTDGNYVTQDLVEYDRDRGEFVHSGVAPSNARMRSRSELSRGSRADGHSSF